MFCNSLTFAILMKANHNASGGSFVQKITKILFFSFRQALSRRKTVKILQTADFFKFLNSLWKIRCGQVQASEEKIATLQQHQTNC